MLRWSFAFLAIALLAAILGFGNIAEGAADIARILFFIFIAAWGILLFGGLFLVKKK